MDIEPLAALSAAPEPPAPRVRARVVAAVRSLWRQEGPLLVLVLALAGLGVFLRVYDLGYPAHMTWDEDHFVNNARNYLAGKPDVNDHPPLGKLLMAAAMRVGGDNSIAWRTVPLVLGLASIVFAFLLGRRLFDDVRAGLLAGAFVAADGFFTTYSRSALMDGMLACFFLASALSFLRARHAWQIAVGAVLAGCAASVKFTGVVLTLPLLATCWFQRRQLPWWSFLLTAFFPLVYFGVFAFGLSITGKPAGFRGVIDASLNLLAQHKNANTKFHPASSLWYTWFVPMEPITLRYFTVTPTRIRGLITLGNPLLWWGAVLALGAALARAAVFAYRRLRRRAPTDPGSRLQAEAWLFACWVLPILPWIVSDRDSYIYHYLPAYGFALVLLAGQVTALARRRRTFALSLVVAVALMTAFHAPLSGQLAITHSAWRQRLFLPFWN